MSSEREARWKHTGGAQRKATSPLGEKALGGVPTQPGRFLPGATKALPKGGSEPLSLQGPGSGRHHPWPVGASSASSDRGPQTEASRRPGSALSVLV